MKQAHDNMSVKHWEHRPEQGWDRFRFNQPYAKGLQRLNDEVLGKTNFDPATLWQWGTMQALALIKMLGAAEAAFGAEGQKIMLESLRQVGYDLGMQVVEGTTMDPEMSSEEWVSYYATVMNRIAYASLESPSIDGGGMASFHIDWCPHQDVYAPFDCRVQRYFVQGMIDAAMDYTRSQGREVAFDVLFKTTIPSGAETCFFEMHQGDSEQARAWGEYTKVLEEKALVIAVKNKAADLAG